MGEPDYDDHNNRAEQPVNEPTLTTADLAGMAAHLAAKHEWIRALSDTDHVARMLVRGLATDPTRLDEVIAEIAMGRSIVEG